MMTSGEAIKIALDDPANHAAVTFDLAATLFVGEAGAALRQLCETKAALIRAKAALDESCNGWRNSETWLASLWIDNDPAMHDMARRIGRKAESDIVAGESIRDTWEETICADQPESGFVADLVSSALRRVDWREIGSHFRAE